MTKDPVAVCCHGVRLPWACDKCEELAWAAKAKVEEMNRRLALAKPGDPAIDAIDCTPCADGRLMKAVIVECENCGAQRLLCESPDTTLCFGDAADFDHECVPA